MKFIRNGWQYSVWDLENGRVKKKKLSKIVQFFIIFRQTNYYFSKIISEQNRVNEQEKISNEYIISNLKTINTEIIGNPLFIDRYSYEQDKVVILGDILKNCSPDKGIMLIDQFIDLIYKTWEYGFRTPYLISQSIMV